MDSGNGKLSSTLGGIATHATTLEISMENSKKLKINLPQDPVILLFGIYPKDSFFFRATCTAMSVVALLTIAKKGKQLKCSSADEWILKVWNIYKMEFYSMVKKNSIMKFAGEWIEPETVILTEVTESEK